MKAKNLLIALVFALGGGLAFHGVAGAGTTSPTELRPQSRPEPALPGPDVFEAGNGKCKSQCTTEAGECRTSCKSAKCANDCNKVERSCKSNC